MNRRALLLIVILLLSSITIPTLASAENNDSRNQPIKIGFLNDASGPVANFGPGWESAAEKAEYDLNADGGNFELVYADSGCDQTMGMSAAQALVDAGVVAVAGAACSIASMGANAVLSVAGIPMVSYASTSPALIDNLAYPSFYRVEPSGGLEGWAINATVRENGDSNVALIHMTSYWPELATTFQDAWEAGGDSLCTKIGYVDTTTDFTSTVQSVLNNGCSTVVMISYANDGALLIEELFSQGFSGSIYAPDQIAENPPTSYLSDPSLLDGIIATKFAPRNVTNSTLAFSSWCVNNTDCAGGIYTAQAYDAVKIIGESYNFAQNFGISTEYAIQYTGNQYEGASGPITFDNNGDQVEIGFDICEFEYYTSNASISLICPQVWYPTEFYYTSASDSDGDGTPDLWDACPNDPNDWLDTDGDGVCNYSDSDDDDDGYTDDSDAFPFNSAEWIDADADGIGDNADLDDDNDGVPDDSDDFPNDPAASTDTDDDGMPDTILANMTTSLTEDQDDDNDGYLDYEDDFPLNRFEWLDSDGDGIGDNADWDDDNDGWHDTEEIDCGTNLLDSSSLPPDNDDDEICDVVDYDDDNDGRGDDMDAFPMDNTEWDDTDMDGIGNNADFDDDGDSWADIREEECGYDPLDSNSIPPDLDFDNECDELDPDDDGDTILDHLDEFPRDNSEWSDNDLDGIGDNADDDDDNDYWKDTAELACWTDPLSSFSFPPDNDADGICDIIDNDDDNDGTVDESDEFPFNSAEWLDTDSDGIGNNADLDDDADMLTDLIELQIGTDPLNKDTDGDGFYDPIDELPLDPTEWSDIDGDGVGDNSDAFPSLARYHTVGGLLFEVVIFVVIIISIVTLVVILRGRNRN